MLALLVMRPHRLLPSALICSLAMAASLLAGSGYAAPVSRAPARVGTPSSSEAGVTIYGASWCGPCKMLEQGLRERQIPFDEIDIDRNPTAFERARQATGSSSIPQTSVAGTGGTVWIIGADVAGVERAYRR
jgi:mycoredoxin